MIELESRLPSQRDLVPRYGIMAVVAATAAVQRTESRPVDGSALTMGAAAALLPSLPDALEPALNPNHRQSFHSVAFGTAVAYSMRRAYLREARDPWGQVARAAILVGGAAYLAHLVRDAFTAKSIPLI